MKSKASFKNLLLDILCAIVAGFIVGTRIIFFRTVTDLLRAVWGGLATITHHLLADKVSWSALMIAFNLPIFVLLSVFVNKKLGAILTLYMLVQSFAPRIFDIIGAKPYSLLNNQEDFNIVFACIATGVISGFGFSLMLRRFGASGGTYGISALIKKAKPDMNIAYVSFIMDASVVFIAFFVYGMRITPVICTFLNLFVANIIVDKGLKGVKNRYRFEIITSRPDELAKDMMMRLHHGITQIQVHGVYSDTDKYMLVCIINRRQIGEMMKILKSYPDAFASFERVSEVFGNFKRGV